jgi:putative membrane protein
MNSWTHVFITGLKGFFMGAANIVPGVSGGTIAFITDIYEKLVDSIQGFDTLALKRFFRGQWSLLANQINLSFLITLLIGIVIATFGLAQLMEYLLEHHTVPLWAFFFGLILASALVIIKQISRWTAGNVASLVIGIGIAYYITSLTMIQTPDSGLYLFFAGALAMATMILPGVSGSYVLLIMDKYGYVISLITSINGGIKSCLEALFAGNIGAIPGIIISLPLFPLFIFTAGAIVGVVGVAKLLSWLLKRFYTLTITFLTGFMVGSLNKIWPWKETLEWYTDPRGKRKPLEQVNILPPEYDTTFWIAIFVAVVGFAAVYAIEYFGQQRESIV